MFIACTGHYDGNGGVYGPVQNFPLTAASSIPGAGLFGASGSQLPGGMHLRDFETEEKCSKLYLWHVYAAGRLPLSLATCYFFFHGRYR